MWLASSGTRFQTRIYYNHVCDLGDVILFFCTCSVFCKNKSWGGVIQCLSNFFGLQSTEGKYFTFCCSIPICMCVCAHPPTPAETKVPKQYLTFLCNVLWYFLISSIPLKNCWLQVIKLISVFTNEYFENNSYRYSLSLSPVRKFHSIGDSWGGGGNQKPQERESWPFCLINNSFSS